MMAGGTNAPNQRPDTLMQDRISQDRRKPLATHGRTIQSGQNEKSPFSGLCQLPPAADITIRWSSTRRAGSMVIALVEILRLIGPWPFPRHCCGSHNL